jgi:hypothetical protein
MMSGHQHDADLRQRFHALRGEEEPTVPAFRIPGRRSVRRPPAVVIAAAAAVIAVAGILWLSSGGRGRQAAEFQLDLTQRRWVSPTDFLLETPGIDLLRGEPALLNPETLPGLDSAARRTEPPNPENMS